MNPIKQTMMISAVVWGVDVEVASAQRLLECDTPSTCADLLQEVAPLEVDPKEQPRLAKNISALFAFIGENPIDSISVAVDDDQGTFEGEVLRTTPNYVERLEFSIEGRGQVVMNSAPRYPELDEIVRFLYYQFDYPSRARPGANVLTNPGFEQALSGWASSGRAAIRRADPDPFEGTSYLYGDATRSFMVSQDVLLRAWISPDEIDTGALKVVFGGWQAGWNTQKDFGVISIFYVDDAGVELGSQSLAAFYSNHSWVEQTGTGELPSGTRTLRFRFVGTRMAGSNNDAYLDAAYACVVDPAGSSDGSAQCQQDERN